MTGTEGLPLVPPRQPVTDDLAAVIRLAVSAVDYELLCMPAPASSVRSPFGVAQPETPAERTRRVVETAIMYAIENDLLVMPDAISDRLDGYFVAQRAAP